ncbi:MAG: FkbM family methyltransferase [Patescibacteria group bacterium]
MIKILKKITPQFVFTFVGRYHVIKNTESFLQQPLYSILKLVRWTIFELLGLDISFTTPDGTRFTSMTRNYSSFIVYFTDYRDPSIQLFLNKHLTKDSIFVDAGANIGTYTIRAGQQVGSQGKVIAVEAHPSIYKYLLKNIELNNLNNITPVNVALGSERGTTEISYNDSNPGETHVAINGEKSIVVPIQTLDEVLEKLGVDHVDYLKIDVEGFELPLLLGSQETIKNNPEIVIQTELVEKHSKRYGRSVTQITDLLSSFGLIPHELDFEGNPAKIEKFDLARKEYDVLWWRE